MEYVAGASLDRFQFCLDGFVFFSGSIVALSDVIVTRGDDGGVFGDKAAVTGADIPVPFASSTVTVRRLPTRPVQDASPKVTLRLS